MTYIVDKIIDLVDKIMDPWMRDHVRLVETAGCLRAPLLLDHYRISPRETEHPAGQKTRPHPY